MVLSWATGESTDIIILKYNTVSLKTIHKLQNIDFNYVIEIIKFSFFICRINYYSSHVEPAEAGNDVTLFSFPQIFLYYFQLPTIYFV